MSKHTKKQCFNIVGYPDWWSDGHKRNNRPGEEKRKSFVAMGDTEVTNTGGGSRRETRQDVFGGAVVGNVAATNSGRRLHTEEGTKQTKRDTKIVAARAIG